MRAVKPIEKTELRVTNMTGYYEKTVTPFGNSAKIDCPKEHIGKKAYVIILKK